MSTIIDTIPGTWSADQPKKYEPVLVSWFIEVAGVFLGAEIGDYGTGEGVCNEAVFRQLLSWNRAQVDINVTPKVIYLCERFKGQDSLIEGLTHQTSRKL
jgi:hypothetical protein